MSCNPPPTQTLYRTDTTATQSVGTSTENVVTTLPPTSTTSTQSSCVSTASNGTSCAAYSTTEIIIEIPGGVSTSQRLFPYTTNVILTDVVATETLFGSCSSSSSTTTPDLPTSSSSSTSPVREDSTTTHPPTTPARPTVTVISTSIRSNAPTLTRASSTEYSISYGTPSTYTSSVTITLSNGLISTSASVGTSTPTIWVPKPPENASSGPGVGLIVGSVLGGFAAVGIIGVCIWLWWRKRGTRWDDIFDEGHEPGERRRMDLVDTEPKPYEYGIVGAQSPPGTPLVSPLGMHDRRASSAPLLVSGTFSTSHSTSASIDNQLSPPMSPHNPMLALSPDHRGRPGSAGGGSMHSRDLSHLSVGSAGNSTRAYSDDHHGIVSPASTSSGPPTVSSGRQSYPVDRKVRPHQGIMPRPPGAGAPAHEVAAASSVSPSSPQPVSPPTPIPTPAPAPAPAAVGLDDLQAPPPYSQAPPSAPNRSVSPADAFQQTNVSHQGMGMADPRRESRTSLR